MRNRRILLINPPQSVHPSQHFNNIKIPLGLIYLAGKLEENNFEVKILDCPVHYTFREKISSEQDRIGLPFQEIKKVIEEFKPSIIGVSCAYSMYEHDSFDVINKIKENFKDILIVVGGAHSSANTAYVLRNKNIDMVVIGEGEETLLEIANKYYAKKNMTSIKGTALILKNKVKINKPRSSIKEIDNLKAAWHLIDINLYFNHPDNSLATLRKNSIDIITSRGCPGNCVFCSIHTVWGRSWRGRSPKNVVDEIEMLVREYNAKQFRIQDDNLTLNKDRIMAICKEINNRNLDIKWDTPNGIAIWTLDEEVLSAMKKAGCYRITFGIESGCPNTQKYIRKIINVPKVKRLIDFCHSIGLWVCATFIIGFPKETKKDIKLTQNFIFNSKINFPFVYIAQPYPGTDMHRDFRDLGLFKEQQESSNLFNSKYNTLYLSNNELNKKQAIIYRQFYIRKILRYINPFIFYNEFLSKIRTYEDFNYVYRMLRAVIFEL